MHVNFRTYYFIYISTIWKIILLLYFKPPPRIYMYFKSAYKQIHDINNVTNNNRVIEWHTRSITNIRNIHAHTYTHMHAYQLTSLNILVVRAPMWLKCAVTSLHYMVFRFSVSSAFHLHTHICIYIYKGMDLFYMSRWMGVYTWLSVSF